MGINAQNKGKTGEREIANKLRVISAVVGRRLGYTEERLSILREEVQRNQNQSAVGGCDIAVFGLAIEVKRQENLSVRKWWMQTVKSASDLNSIPILIYRQNRGKWHVVVESIVPTTGDKGIRVISTIEEETFYVWLEHYLYYYLPSFFASR